MSFRGYAAYIDSGIEWLGDIPSGWAVDKFRYVFRESGEKIEDEIVGDMLSVSGYRGIEIKAYDDDNRRRLDHELVGYRVVRPGQLVVNTMWLNYAGLGVSSHEGHVSPAYRSYYINPVIDRRYAHHLLRSDVYVQGYTRLLTGIRPNSLQMSRDDLMMFPVLIPPLDEQGMIAEFLDHETAKIDDLITEQQRLIELLKEKRQAVISHAVTKGLNPNAPMKDSGVEWLGEVPAHWGVSELKYAVDPQSSITYGIVQAGEEVPDGVPYIKTGDMAGDELRPDTLSRTSAMIDANYTRSRVSPGDIVIAIRATIGKALPVPESLKVANLTQGTAKIRPGDAALKGFLLYAISASYMQSYFNAVSKGATFKEITLDALRRTPIALPPIEEQKLIVDAINAQIFILASLEREAERSECLLKDRRSALISAAVTGKIDVRSWRQPEDEAEKEVRTLRRKVAS